MNKIKLGTGGVAGEGGVAGVAGEGGVGGVGGVGSVGSVGGVGVRKETGSIVNSDKKWFSCFLVFTLV